MTILLLVTTIIIYGTVESDAGCLECCPPRNKL